MDSMIREKKIKAKRQEILNLAKKYLDEDGQINMKQFRQEQNKTYALLSYYFNGVNGLLDAISMEKTEEESKKEKDKKSSGRGCPVNGQSVRNELAYDMLLLLRKNHTLNEIGEMYGVSRAHIHQLLQVMDKNTYLEDRPVELEMLI